MLAEDEERERAAAGHTEIPAPAGAICRSTSMNHLHIPRLLLLALVGASLLAALPATTRPLQQPAPTSAHHDAYADQPSAAFEAQDPKPKQGPKQGAGKKKRAKPT
ncbi:MAG: hypothetical protein MUC36_03250 [Planctomycetes bacterium]|jgi:hypothetical protein|nr:hypothetical protein [Planctomycetota bacterium]